MSVFDRAGAQSEIFIANLTTVDTAIAELAALVMPNSKQEHLSEGEFLCLPQ
jgi:hypothetical protein